jgi:predicted dehydrogenase
MKSLLQRRDFLRQVAAAGSVAPFADVLLAEQSKTPPLERLNIGVIGVNGRGAENLAAVSSENVVALCDVDLARAGEARVAFPKASFYQDFRKLLDHNGIEAVVLSTPDHMHAVPGVMALRLGMHLYCEKPLAHSVYETRVLREVAAENRRVTQLGTQIHSGSNYRRAVEIIQAGVIGAVERVHVWFTGRPKTGKRVQQGTPPATLDYDLWLGPAPYRPYHPSHCHYHWRWWWDFANGILGDFGCHYLDLPFWALKLRYPTSIEAAGEKDHDGENDVPALMRVEFNFPARGELPPVQLTWHHGGWKPKEADQYPEYCEKSAILFVGSEGQLLADYSTHKLYPEEKFHGLKTEHSIPESIGHHKEWLQAIKRGGQATCNFDYSGALTETVLLGNVAYRTGKKLEWDAATLKVTNDVREAAGYIQREYRKGWTL